MVLFAYYILSINISQDAKNCINRKRATLQWPIVSSNQVITLRVFADETKPMVGYHLLLLGG